MKRILIILASLTLLLSSCSGKGEVRQDFFRFPIESKIKAELDGKEYLLNLHMSTNDDLTLTIIKPTALKDMQISLNGGNTYIKYHGIDIPIDGDYAKEYGILLLRHIFSYDKGSFDSASITRISGIKYCKQRYVENGNIIDIYFPDGSDIPSIIEASINGREIKITFVND